MKIIAVDDEKIALSVLVDAIKEALPNAEILAMSSPEEALDAAKRQDCQVVFTDIQMPGMSGLSLAKQLKHLNPQINIIFVTGYSEYAADALRLHASGYLEKPVRAEDIVEEIKNLRHPLKRSHDRIHAMTFGNFDFFINDEPLTFTRSKSKELLAYLIDRRGATVTRREIASVLFENGNFSRADQAYLSMIATDLEKDLEAKGAGDIFIRRHRSYAIDPTGFSCDAYDYLAGDPTAINLFCGEYMEQYSWAEYFKDKFYE